MHIPTLLLQMKLQREQHTRREDERTQRIPLEQTQAQQTCKSRTPTVAMPTPLHQKSQEGSLQKNSVHRLCDLTPRVSGDACKLYCNDRMALDLSNPTTAANVRPTTTYDPTSETTY